MSGKPICEICGQPMPEGEEMFMYHGFSGPCPKPTQNAFAPCPYPHDADSKCPDREPERRNALSDALKAIVKDAEDRNEPGQSWVTIRGGLIDEAKQALAKSRD